MIKINSSLFHDTKKNELLGSRSQISYFKLKKFLVLLEASREIACQLLCTQ